ncbi:MAG TPA: amidohydrolase [Burkholderiales bacterium]|nr:amidohydrolase [Burkholderiales bacterium]
MHPDTILHRGRIYTADARASVVEALAIRDGAIVATGTSPAMLAMAGPGTRKVDLEGRAAVPGFIDGHPHMDDAGMRLVLPSFDSPKCIADVLETVRHEVAKRKPGEWVVLNPIAEEPAIFSYPKAFAEGRWPTRHDLDAVSPANPVYIQPLLMVAPGTALANSAALQLAGIDGRTPAPEGVRIEKDARGEPTGVFLDYNFPKVMPDIFGGFGTHRPFFPMIPPISDAQVARAVEVAMREFNRLGITAIYEGHGIPKQPQAAYLDLWLSKKLTVRTYFVISYPVSLYGDSVAGDALIRETALYAAGEGFGDDRLKFGGLGFSFDSATAIGASLMREPYLGARGHMWNGIQLTQDETFREILQKVARAGLRVQVQCAGGAAIDKVLGMFAGIDREIPIKGKRWVIEHCQFPSLENMALCRELGVIPTSTTNFLWNYGSIYLRSFGEKTAGSAIPFRTWLDQGVPVVQSTDGRPYDPIFSFWQMLARKDGVTGHVFGLPEQKLTRAEALRLYTYNAAYVAFWEHRIGSLEPGKLADLAILSDDIMTMPEDRIPEAKVLTTLLAGRPVHDTGLFS